MTTKARKPARTAQGKGKAPRGERTRLADELARRYAQAGARMLADDVPQRLDPRIAAELAPITGVGPEDVRLHTGSRASRMAGQMGARAFALSGGDVFFAKGHFQPDTAHGKALLAHEMAHVAEGASGRAARDGGRPDDESEQAARRTEALVLAREDARRRQPEEEPAEPADVDMAGSATGADGTSGPQRVRIDKAVLEDKVHRALERALRRERERSGR